MKERIENLQKSFELSSQQVGDAVNPLEVAALFESQKVSYVLIGGLCCLITRGRREPQWMSILLSVLLILNELLRKSVKPMHSLNRIIVSTM